MWSFDLLLGVAVVALGFLALWSQFGRRVALQAAALVEIIRTKYRRDEVRVWRNDTGAASAWRRV